MKKSYPVYSPYKSYTTLVVEPLYEVPRPSFVLHTLFLPLTAVGDDPYDERSRRCDHLLHVFNTFEPTNVLTSEELTVKKNRTLPDYEFINYKLPENLADEFQKWTNANSAKFWTFLGSLTEAGYKLSVSPDLDNACVIATITATKYATNNNGFCLSSRSDDAMEAVWLSLYKHFVVFDGGTWEAGTVRSNWG